MKKQSVKEVKYSFTYSPQFEAERQKSLMPHDRHQEMLENHKQERASRKEAHRKGFNKVRMTPHRLV
jgi:hypothetical protein